MECLRPDYYIEIYWESCCQHQVMPIVLLITTAKFDGEVDSCQMWDPKWMDLPIHRCPKRTLIYRGNIPKSTIYRCID